MVFCSSLEVTLIYIDFPAYSTHISSCTFFWNPRGSLISNSISLCFQTRLSPIFLISNSFFPACTLLYFETAKSALITPFKKKKKKGGRIKSARFMISYKLCSDQSHMIITVEVFMYFSHWHTPTFGINKLHQQQKEIIWQIHWRKKKSWLLKSKLFRESNFLFRST